MLSKTQSQLVKTALAFAPKKHTIPNLTKVQFGDVRRSLIVTDLDTWVSVEAGTATLNLPQGLYEPKAFLQLIKAVDHQHEQLTAYRFTLPKNQVMYYDVEPASSYPAWPDFPTDPSTAMTLLDKKELWSAASSQYLKSAAGFAGDSDSTVSLQGVVLDVKTGRCTVAATNSATLFSADFDTDLKSGFFLIPAAVIKKLLPFFDDAKLVTVKKGSEFVKFHFKYADADAQVVTRLIDANYPDYKGVFPKDFAMTVKFNPSKMLESLKDCPAKKGNTVLVFAIKENRLTLSTSMGYNGSKWFAEIDAEVQGLSADKWVTGYQLGELQKVVQAVASYDAEAVTMQFKGVRCEGVSSRAAMLTPAGNEAVKVLIMPVYSKDNNG